MVILETDPGVIFKSCWRKYLHLQFTFKAGSYNLPCSKNTKRKQISTGLLDRAHQKSATERTSFKREL